MLNVTVILQQVAVLASALQLPVSTLYDVSAHGCPVLAVVLDPDALA